jgi:hypothetical protein
MNVLGYLLDDSKHEVEGLILPKGGCVKDQTFVDDTTLYLKGSWANMNRTKVVLEIFCKTWGAKVN